MTADSLTVAIFLAMHVGDTVTATGHLDEAQMGVCARLWLAAWPRGGRIPRVHVRRLSGVVDEALWAMIWPAISDLWPVSDDGQHVYWPGMPEAVERARTARAAAVAKARRRWGHDAGQDAGHDAGQDAQKDAGLMPPDSGLRTPETEHQTPDTDLSRSPRGDRAGTGYSDSFLRFWAAWPKKVAKEGAWKVWQAKRCDAHLEAIVSALTWQTTSAKWTEASGQYIPHPDKYLRGRLWDDDPAAYARKSTPARDVRPIDRPAQYPRLG